MQGAYGPTLRDIFEGAQTYNVNRQNAAINAADAAQRQQMNLMKLQRAPIEAQQADWEFEQKKQVATKMQGFADEARLNGIESAIQKFPELLTIPQQIEMRALAAKKAEDAAQKARLEEAAAGQASQYVPFTTAPSVNGQTSLAAIDEAGRRDMENVAQAEAVARAMPEKSIEQGFALQKQELINQAAAERARIAAGGKKGPRGLFDIAADVTELTNRKSALEEIIADVNSAPEEVASARSQLFGVENALAKARRDAEGVQANPIKIANDANRYRRALALETDPTKRAELQNLVNAADAAAVKAGGAEVTYTDPTGKKMKFMKNLATGEMVELGTENPAEVTEANVTEAQKDIADAERVLLANTTIRKYYKPDFLTFEARGGNWVNNMLEMAKLGDGKAVEARKEFYKFKAAVDQQKLGLRRDITGAAGSKEEFADIVDAYLSGTIGQTEFEAKLDLLDEAQNRTIETNRGRAMRKKDYSAAGKPTAPTVAPPPPPPPAGERKFRVIREVPK